MVMASMWPHKWNHWPNPVVYVYPEVPSTKSKIKLHLPVNISANRLSKTYPLLFGHTDSPVMSPAGGVELELRYETHHSVLRVRRLRYNRWLRNGESGMFWGGSIQKSGEKVRINAQLIDAITGHHLWAEKYDRELKDIFALQDEITLQIISAVGAELTGGERTRILAKGTNKFEAYEKIIQGWEYWYGQAKKTKPGWRLQKFLESIPILM